MVMYKDERSGVCKPFIMVSWLMLYPSKTTERYDSLFCRYLPVA